MKRKKVCDGYICIKSKHRSVCFVCKQPIGLNKNIWWNKEAKKVCHSFCFDKKVKKLSSGVRWEKVPLRNKEL